ncbi:MAG: hypothetical protein CBC48_16855 [bacterium TMED88]|nr:hypothetical protein [Deltaproteobacteria bacterium]OUV25059.1 MAG: hypothetical protein CBC48_16855 [bacterium TMED88]
MKFLLRDDDTCAMTRPEDLEVCYQSIWDQVPICLSVTPFRIPGRATGVPENLIGSKDVLPLAECAALLGFLREQVSRGRFDLALHGYHHNRVTGLPEFVGATDLNRKAVEGRAELERLFGRRIETFVPPNNTLSADGFDAVILAGMNVVNNQTRARLQTGWGRLKSAAETVVAARYALTGRFGAPLAFRIRHFPKYQQAPYFTVGPDSDLENLEAQMQACRSNGDVFVLATHYHAFGRRMRSGQTIGDGVMYLVERAASWPDVQFVDYEGLW